VSEEVGIMIIGTRESGLALRQTDIFLRAAKGVMPNESFTVVKMKSGGDIDQSSALQGFGMFVRELDAALLDGSIDASVNSMKDVPILPEEGLCIPAILPRDAVEDVILPLPISELPAGATVGTSSLRRAAIVGSVRPDLNVAPLRGNIHTRLDKLDAGRYDAIILARAGLDRMGIDRDMHVLDPDVFIPAPAQGAISISCRSNDMKTIEKLIRLDDKTTRIETAAERAVMRMMGAGCTSPIGVNAKCAGDALTVRAVFFGSDGIPVRTSRIIPCDFTDDDISPIAAALGGGI
jgi:hydroxymethylbilane synthase